MWTQIPLTAQVVRDESELAAKPSYINAVNMRSVDNKMETTYGQELVASTALTGICRGSYSYVDLSRTIWGAFGTHLRLYAVNGDGITSDITPIISYGQVTNKITTTNGTATTINITSHGLVVDQLFYVLSQSATVGGITLAGAYPVVSITDANNFVITTATATAASAGGGILNYGFGLAPGNQSNLNGLGYGVGGYGSGGYGGSTSAQDLDARTWSFTAWGQNLIANPNWGAIYEWAPNTSQSELISTGDFSGSTGWTAGTGWAIGAGVATASVADVLSQAVSLQRSAWHLLRFDVVRNSGTITPLIGTSTVGSTPITTTGSYLRTFFSPVATAQTLKFDGGHTFNGTVDNVSLQVLTTGNVITGAPSSAGSVFLTAERNLVACGSTDPVTSLLDPMLVRWCAQANNQDWVASAANVAGSYALSHGSRIVRGMPGNRENLIFTDTAVYRMRSVPDPGVVYAFDLLGEGCGLIGPNAVVQVDGTFFWISPQGQFYTYQGGVPTPLNNPSNRDFDDNLANGQGQKIYAFALPGRSEVGFLYPDERDGLENSRVHRFNYQDNTWVSGPYAFTSMLGAGLFPYPVSVDSSGYIRYQEKGFDNDGSARATTLETSYFNIADGDTFATINGFMPDFDDLMGGAAITFYSKNYPQDTARSYGPFNVTSATKRVSARIKGRQLKYKITTNASPSFYRVGAFTFDLNKSGQRR